MLSMGRVSLSAGTGFRQREVTGPARAFTLVRGGKGGVPAMVATSGASVRPVVVSLHGIRTTGGWQKDLIPVLHEAGFDYVALDYGYFGALQMAIPFLRERKIDEIHGKLVNHPSLQGRTPSVIAHSFGSYLITRVLAKYDTFRVDRMVLCGSIVARDYPWDVIIGDRRQASAVLNDRGGLDFWAGIVGYFVKDAGPSGVDGFEQDAGGRVFDRHHARHRHSDYFTGDNYRLSWVPFLRGHPANKIVALPKRKTNWRFVATACVLGLAIAAAGFAWKFPAALEGALGQPAVVDKVEAPSPAATDVAREAGPASMGSTPAVAEPLAQLARFRIKADRDCVLLVDGQEKATLVGGVGSELSLAAGTHDFSCRDPLTDFVAPSVSMEGHSGTTNVEIKVTPSLQPQFVGLEGVWVHDESEREAHAVPGGECAVATVLRREVSLQSYDSKANTILGAYVEYMTWTASFTGEMGVGKSACNRYATDAFDKDRLAKRKEGAVRLHYGDGTEVAEDSIECYFDEDKSRQCDTTEFGTQELGALEYIGKDKIRYDGTIYSRRVAPG